MYCPYCGRDIPQNTTICPACHGLISEATMAAYFQGQSADSINEYSRATVERQLAEKQPRRVWPIIVAVAVVLALLVAFIAVPLIQESVASARTDHRVTFLLKTPGYNDEATAIPVHVTGTKANGSAYDEITYLDGGGNGVSLEPGEYQLSFPGGSILANGTVLVAPKKKTLDVTVPDGLARNEFVQVPTDKAITYQAIAPLDLTDEVLDAVYEYAAQAPNDRGKADRLRENAMQVRADEIEKKEAHAAAIEKEATGKLKVSLGDEAKFIGTLEINTAEEVANRLGDESIMWNLEGQTLAVLWLDKTRKVTVETSMTDEYDGGELYFDEDDGMTYTDSQQYEVKCLVLNSDVEGIYGGGDDGTLTAHAGKRVIATGRVNMPDDWASSLVSPIMLANPTIENL